MVNKTVRWIMFIIFSMFLFACFLNRSACADYHYLSSGTTGGDADGSSLANAWKTFSAITGVSAGDTIYCAGTYTAQLTVADTVSYVVVTDSTWTIDGGNTLVYGILGTNKKNVIIDGCTLLNFKKGYAYAVAFEGGSNNTVKNCDISKVYYATNPNPGSTAWEQMYGVAISFTNCDGATITGNTITDCGSAGITYGVNDNSNLTNACEIANNDLSNLNVGIRISTGNTTGGVAVTNVKIHNNYTHDFNNYYYCNAWHRDAIHCWSKAANTNVSVEDVEIYDNYYDDTVNPTLGGTATIYVEYNCKNFKIHHNVLGQCPAINAIRFKGLEGIIPYTAGGHEIYNNTIISKLNETNGTGIYSQWTIGNKIKNNIFYVSKYAYIISSASDITGFEADYNVIKDFDGGDIASIPTGFKTFAALQSAGFETYGIAADPLFVGGTGSASFKLAVGSPAIDVGTVLGFTEDAKGDTIPQGTAPEIGAYEFNTNPTAPTNLTATVNLPRHSVFTFVDNSADEQGFQIMYNGVVIDSLSADTETFSIDNEAPGTKCNVQVTAYKGAITSGATAVTYDKPRYRMQVVR